MTSVPGSPIWLKPFIRRYIDALQYSDFIDLVANRHDPTDDCHLLCARFVDQLNQSIWLRCCFAAARVAPIYRCYLAMSNETRRLARFLIQWPTSRGCCGLDHASTTGRLDAILRQSLLSARLPFPPTVSGWPVKGTKRCRTDDWRVKPVAQMCSSIPMRLPPARL